VTLSPEQLARMLEQIPDDWQPLFACGRARLRKGSYSRSQRAMSISTVAP